MISNVIFIGSNQSILAKNRYKKLQILANKNSFFSFWFDKEIGIKRFIAFFELLKLLFKKKKYFFICHGSYWPELILLIIVKQKYSLIVQGSEAYIASGLRGLIHKLIIKNSISVGCRSKEQEGLIKDIFNIANTFILRMDEFFMPPSMIKLDEKKLISSVRASSDHYRIEIAAKISNIIKKTRNLDSLYIKYNGADKDPSNKLFDQKINNFLDSNELSNVLSKSFYVISVPKTDGLSNIIIESLICGAIIICSESSFKEEFYEYKNNFIVLPEEVIKNQTLLEITLTKKIKTFDFHDSSSIALSVHKKFNYNENSVLKLLSPSIYN